MGRQVVREDRSVGVERYQWAHCSVGKGLEGRRGQRGRRMFVACGRSLLLCMVVLGTDVNS